jgi:uncharacterized BrkB/YihY/UPF0761 family membrane protein
MSTFLTRRTIPQLSLLIIFLFLVCCFSIGQAVTFSWLSNFPERATQLDKLQAKYWIWLIVGLIAAAIDLLVVVHLIKRFLQARKKKPAA